MDSHVNSKISAIVRELILLHGQPVSESANPSEQVHKFVMEQMGRMPWFSRSAIQLLTIFFAASGFAHSSVSAHLQNWSRSRLSPCRDFVRFYAALVVLSLYSQDQTAAVSSRDE